MRLPPPRPPWLRVVTGAWRTAPPPSLDAAELRAITPRLLRAGLAPLVWWRFRGEEHLATALRPLDDVRRLTAVQHALGEECAVRAFHLLRGAGVEPILGKGWAAARSYPDPSLRPYGDVDLFVRPGEEPTARDALLGPEGDGCAVDLHAGAKDLHDAWERLLARSVCVPLRQETIRVFGPEDHLRLLACHALRHGLRRPLWLCDVAVAVERAEAGFDWDHALRPPRRAREAVLAVCALAGDLLGARLEETPPRVRRHVAPSWLTRTVLREWSSGDMLPQGARTPAWLSLRRRVEVLPALRRRWPNAIEATVDLGAPLNALPRLPFQIVDLVWRGVRFAWQPRRYLPRG